MRDAAENDPPSLSVLTGPGYRRLTLQPTVVMGVLNVTPDSFSDGGLYNRPSDAVAHGLSLIDSGARIVDVGAESTRPGSEPISAATQIKRLSSVLGELRASTDCFLSVDTSEPAVMEAAADFGVDMINDVRGLRAAGAVEVVAKYGLAACIGHMQGEPATMQREPRYDDVVGEVQAYLAHRVEACRQAGMGIDRLCVDPGFGFGKTWAHNMAMLQSIERFDVSGRPVVLGVSRKSMFARIFADDSPEARLNGSLASAVWAVSRGVSIVRAHDVRATAQVCQLAELLCGPRVMA